MMEVVIISLFVFNSIMVLRIYTQVSKMINTIEVYKITSDEIIHNLSNRVQDLEKTK